MITLGEESYITNKEIGMYGDVQFTIGKYCSIAAGLRIESGVHAPSCLPKLVSSFPFFEQWPEAQEIKFSRINDKNIHKVTVGNDVWIATMATLLDGVTVYDGAVIAAHSVVTKDVPPYAFVAGNPARIKRFRFSPDVIHQLEDIRWWDWPKGVIIERLKDFEDIDIFVNKYGRH